MQYSGPKKLGGYISCYFNKKANEWLFIHDDEQWQTTNVAYLLPTLKKYKNNQIEKKLLLQGEEVTPMGKTYQEGKVYYHLMYRFESLKLLRLKTLYKLKNFLLPTPIFHPIQLKALSS